MNFIQSIGTCYRKYFTFSGRATRAEFWKFILFMFLILIVLVIVNSVIFGPTLTYQYASLEAYQSGESPTSIKKTYSDGYLGDIFFVISFFPLMAVTWRRMHDSGLPGYIPLLVWLVFIIGMLAAMILTIGFDAFKSDLLADGQVKVMAPSVLWALIAFGSMLFTLGLNTYLLVRPSDPKINKYGPNPHEVPT